MDQFFVKFLLLEESLIIGALTVLALAGAVVTALLVKVRMTLGRMAYFGYFVLLYLALILSQHVWLLLPHAAAAGLFSAVPIVSFASFALFGAATYYIAAARSKDIIGETRLAWLGFIPLTNLFLLLKSGAAAAAAPARSGASDYFVNTVKVIAALLVIVIGNRLGARMGASMGYLTESDPALRAVFDRSLTLEESFAAEATISGAELPLRIDDVTVLTAIAAEGGVLHLTYEVEGDAAAFAPGFKNELAALYCAPEMFRADLARGGRIILDYIRQPGDLGIESFEVTQTDCDAL